MKELEAFGEIGGETSGEIRAEFRSGGAGLKDGAMANVLEDGIFAGVSVVDLRKPPDVVIAEVIETFKVRADADLVIKRAAGVVPHLEQPVEAEPRFGGEIGSRTISHLSGKIANADLHQRDDVAVRLDEFEIVAGIPPAALGVDRRSSRFECPNDVVVA